MRNSVAEKEKKPSGPPDHSKQPVLANDYAVHASEIAGMSTEEIIRLLETLERVDPSITVTRRRADKNGKKSHEIGGRKRKMPIDKAIDYEKKRLDERKEKDDNVRKLLGIPPEEGVHENVYDEIYPKRLSPKDIVRCVDCAEQKLDDLDKLRSTRKKVFSPREEIVLNILTLIKQQEVARVARRIAETQRNAVAELTLDELDALREKRITSKVKETLAENSPLPETVEPVASGSAGEQDAWGASAEKHEDKPPRTLTGFKRNSKTLIDEAGEITSENLDLAASIVKQWIGHVQNTEQ